MTYLLTQDYVLSKQFYWIGQSFICDCNYESYYLAAEQLRKRHFTGNKDSCYLISFLFRLPVDWTIAGIKYRGHVRGNNHHPNTILMMANP